MTRVKVATDHYRSSAVSIARATPVYCSHPPFHPGAQYPEFPQGPVCRCVNPGFAAVRDALHLLGLDARAFGTSAWNPLGDVIRRGERVVIKPNFVLSRHYGGGELDAVVTHASILRAVVDYAYKALGGDGSLVIADAPQMDCDFEELLRATSVGAITDFYARTRGFAVPVLDLRDWWYRWDPSDEAATVDHRLRLHGDPSGSVLVNVGRDSELVGLGGSDRLYGADYDREETIRHHHGDVQEYMVSRTILDADVVLSVPKLKVHKKVGVTINAKGFVGVNTNKNFLVHYRLGTPEQGGDQFPPRLLTLRERTLLRIQRFLYDALLARRRGISDRAYVWIARFYRRWLRRVVGGVPTEKLLLDGGNWFGNDSAWRMVVDLMKVVMYGTAEGKIANTPQRRIFSIVDGIVGGEGNGPLTPDAKRAGVVLAGCNPLAVDIVAASVMGLDVRRLKWVNCMLGHESYDFGLESLESIRVLSSAGEFDEVVTRPGRYLAFKPHPGWAGVIERVVES